ncbi:MAG TPA: hypothetical protein VM122_06895 [Usitatibacter sp.]|nr:hypothetical protein [Usitatibacter sp.]
MKNEADDPRRRLLIRMLAAGFFTGVSTEANLALAQILGTPPSKLPPGRSIYRISGDVQVDGQRATLDTKVGGGNVIRTGANSEVVYAIGESAYIARPNTEVIVETSKSESAIVTGLKLLTGKLLSVFPSKRPVQMQTKVASIGIRGTGVYLESDPEQTYFCTCYGVADVAALNDAQSKETVAAAHHDRPLYILANEQPGRNIRNAPFINHTDQELMLIETLVGRQPPFIFPKSDYTGPRRNY